MTPVVPKQRNFLQRLFARPKRPLSLRVEGARQKARTLIAQNRTSIRATQRYMETNRQSMGSIERAQNKEEIEETQRKIRRLQGKMRKINTIKRRGI